MHGSGLTRYAGAGGETGGNVAGDDTGDTGGDIGGDIVEVICFVILRSSGLVLRFSGSSVNTQIKKSLVYIAKRKYILKWNF